MERRRYQRKHIRGSEARQSARRILRFAGWLTYDTSRLFFGTSKTDVENATPSNYTHSGIWFVSDTNESGLPYQTAGSSKRTNLFYDITSAPTDGFGKPSLTPNAYYYKFYARMDNGEVCCSKTFPYIVPAKVTVTQESGGKITQGQSAATRREKPLR